MTQTASAPTGASSRDALSGDASFNASLRPNKPFTGKADKRFLRDAGREVFTGNELLVKGCLEVEGGVHLMTGYPGSPIAGFFDVLGGLSPLLKHYGMRAFQSNNEALSIAAVNGSQMAPVRAIAAFKSVGLHVASDALALGNLAGTHPEGGAVIVCGDDPWCDSTQVPADSRFLLEHLRMPVVEPGTAQELKDWVGLSFKLSQAAGLYVGYVVVTNIADGGGSVLCASNHFPTLNQHQRLALETSRIDLNKVLLPPRTWQQELRIPERFAATREAARRLGINRIIPATQGFPGEVAPIGFVTTGMARSYLEQVLADLGLTGMFPVLNMGMSYPADPELFREFGQLAKRMIVIEERRSFLEKNLRDVAYHELPSEVANDLNARLFGKRFPGDKPGIPEGRGLNPSLLAQLLIPLIQGCEELPADSRNGQLTRELELIKRTGRRKLEVVGSINSRALTEREEPKLALRTPTFCPGCPHRDSSSTLLELRRNLADAGYMKTRHGRGPVDLVAHGDTGCYTMLMFAPTEQLMHNYSGMGLGGGTGSGIDPFIDREKNKQIVFMGDGTFFHSGQIAIANAVTAKQDLTFIILQNGTTAMTGHQGHSATELDLLGDPFPAQDIERICRGITGVSVNRANPAGREDWYGLLESTILRDGVKVLIADKECGITYHRRVKREEAAETKRKGYLPKKTHMNITPEVCEHCLECTKATACPGLVKIETDYGPKIDTDLTWCVNDGACERVRTSNEAGTNVKPCPSFEQVTVVRRKRPKYRLPKLHLAQLPDPTPIRWPGDGEPWRIHMAGVGGMGVGVTGAVLIKAGHKEGWHVAFNEKKGLAIRNGGVFAQVAFATREDAQKHDHAAPIGLIPYGKADLLLGVDILESARAVDPRESFRVAVPERCRAVLNLHKQPTVYTLLGKDDFDPIKMRDRIFDHVDAANSYARNLSDICERHLGSSQWVNIMMLGVAWQLGLIPVSRESMVWAIAEVVKRGRRKNLKAFNIGRRLALAPEALARPIEPANWQELLNAKLAILAGSGFKARRLERLVVEGIRSMPSLPEQLKYDFALRVYDLLMWGGPSYAQRYVESVRGIYRRDSADQGFAATQATIWNLARVMLIKDEPYVAHLLTRPEKLARDRAKYDVDPANGDKLVYRHHTSPEFPLGKHRRLRLKITTTDWQLRLVSKARVLRKLPGWHRRETEFRDWYAGLLKRVDLSTEAEYRRAVEVLSAPAEVSGYREIRYPKQEAVRSRVEALLASPLSNEAVRQSAQAVGAA